MIKIILTLTFFLAYINNFCQNSFNQLDVNGKKNGHWIGYHESSKTKRYEGYFRAGIPSGEFTYYNKKGIIAAKVNFINDSVSISTMFYENGVVMAKGKFINKIKVGKWSTYLKTGDLLNINNYKFGELDGPQYTYYPEDKETKEISLMEEFYCVNGLKDGVWKQYYELGSLKAKGQYHKGLKQGKFEYYFSNGAIDMKGRFVDDKKHGLWYFFDLESEKMNEYIYNNGDIQNKVKE